jgi:arylsulfatase A-like enzyme/thioredoxin-like negative regulator of GroEL
LSGSLRFTFILVLVAVGTCLAALGGWRYARASAPVNGPIILISIDALRADHLPAYGYRRVPSPAIDALAADGIVFDRAYAHSPQTLPSHVSLLSGRLPFATGVRDSVGFTIGKSERLLQQMLRDRGFTTAGVVSSYLLRKETGISQGFTFFDDDTRRPPEPAAEHWLDANGGGRAFLFLHVNRPTQPAEYDRYVADADATVGRLIRYLRAHQLYDRSTIILVSDHGEGLGDHGEETHGLLVNEEALRVPLVIKQPAGEGAGRRVQDPVQVVDLVPTILDFAKAPVPGNLDGRSLQSVLESRGRLAPRVIYSESLFGLYHFGWSSLQTLTDGRYRYVKSVREELYDVAAPPADRVDVADIHPDIVASMRAQLRKLNVPAPKPDARVAEDARARFEAAGEVGFRMPGSALPVVPEPGDDPAEHVGLVEQYRAAVRASVSGDWLDAIDRFRALVRDEPAVADLWMHLGATAVRAERHDVALDAYRHAIELEPESVTAQLRAASALVRLRKLEEAHSLAEGVLGSDIADAAALSNAHELLARIALLQRDAEEARTEAAAAEAADPRRPLIAYVNGRLAYEQGQYAAAADEFDAAFAAIKKTNADLPAELRVYAADTLLRVDRAAEAEDLLLEELREYPFNARVRTTLAALYRATGRPDDATAIVTQH